MLEQNSKITTTSGSIRLLNPNEIYFNTKTTSGGANIRVENNRLAPIEITLETTSGNILVEKNNM